jgi:hypothetical protein
MGRAPHRIEAGAAQAIDRGPGDRLPKPRQQHRHAGDIAIVFARLIGATEHRVVERGPIDSGVTDHQRFDRKRRQIIGADRGERSVEPADGRPDSVANEGLVHAATHPAIGAT